jgi:drug/metabolite transporter (DMT)-like permease
MTEIDDRRPENHQAFNWNFWGRAFVMLSGLFFSLGGILVRLIEEASAWQIVLYRSLSLGVTILIVMAVRQRRFPTASLARAGAANYVAGLCLAVTFIGFIFSLKHTTVANTLLLMSTASFMAAILGWLVLGERVPRVTWMAMVVATAGVAAMVSGGASVGSSTGDVYALLTAFFYACYVIALRRGRTIDMLPSACLAGLIGAIISGGMVIIQQQGVQISGRDLLLCAILGAVQLGCGFLLFTFGSRHVPAVELILLALTEVILAPLWVGLFVGEVPGYFTFLGGGILLVAVVGQVLAGTRGLRQVKPIPRRESSLPIRE